MGGEREGRKRREDGEEKSIYVHGAKITTSLSIPFTAPSKISPVYPPTHLTDLDGNGQEETSGRDEHGRGECVCES